MLTVDARQAKQAFGRLLDEARRTPVAINKHGRCVAVIMAWEDYEARFIKLEKYLRSKKSHRAKPAIKSPRRKRRTAGKSR